MRLLMLLILATAPAFISCYYPRGGHMMDYWDHMSWGYGGFFMWLIFLVLIGFVVYFVVRGEKWMKKSGSDETTLDILKKRYARGEITKQEYERMKKDLE
jgi:putative membrane protein